MRGIDLALVALDPIALLNPLAEIAVIVRNDAPVMLGQRRPVLLWSRYAQIRPPHSAVSYA